MNATAYGVVDNLLTMVDTYGFVLYGNRDYYLNRSEPPFLSDMVVDLYNFNSSSVSVKTLATLAEEYRFWMSKRYDATSKLNFYSAATVLPRPEAYREDEKTAYAASQPIAQGGKGRTNSTVYTAITAGTETGWEFSSRWFTDGLNMTTINTPGVTPVCLNSVMLRFELNMKYLYTQFNMTQEAHNFGTYATSRYATMNEKMFNSAAMRWVDFFPTSTSANFTTAVGV